MANHDYQGDQPKVSTMQHSKVLVGSGPANGDLNASRTGVFVLGMHRSGTSALTRILNLMGAELGAQLLGANQGNASGHWESIPVIEINERILAALGMSWSDPRAMSPSWLEHDEVLRLLPEARLVMEKEFLHAKTWAVKDPRLSRLLNFWRVALAEEKSLSLKAVIAIRHPFEVASSLLRRDDIPLSIGLLLWYLHTSEALRSSRGMARVVIDYADLMKDWKRAIVRVDENLELGLAGAVSSIATQVDDFLDSGLWHERNSGDEEVPAKLMELYRTLKSCESESCILKAEALVESIDGHIALHDSAIRDIHIHRERLRQRVMALELESNDSPLSRDAKALALVENRLEAITSHMVHADWVNSQLEERSRKAEQEAKSLRDINRELISDFEWVERQLQRMLRSGFGVGDIERAGVSVQSEKIGALLEAVAKHVAEAEWVSKELERLNKDSESSNVVLVQQLDAARAQIDELTKQRDMSRATWCWRVRAKLRGSRDD